ncbi:MAG: type IV toxin-antitoxin system AbiEi family antitoxin [Anaerolineales bacterium]|nr:type IV toxin-antitoxin system AbiEi family antitoxin [Anaerolineales bacterium]
MNTKRKPTNAFFDTHSVFSLEEAVQYLAPSGEKSNAIERLKYHLAAGRLKSLGRELYAVVPPGATADSVNPDPFLVAAAARPNGVFAYHSALDLLGAAHSSWNAHTLFVDSRRRPIALKGASIKFLVHPKPFLENNGRDMGTRKLERRARWLRTTGPERTLVECFRNPHYAGGLEELVVSASGFPVLDLDLLFEILEIYSFRKLFAAVGWFLENNQKTFHVSEQYLRDLETRCPQSPQYIIRDQHGGTLFRRWNLILPDELNKLGGPNDS